MHLQQSLGHVKVHFDLSAHLQDSGEQLHPWQVHWLQLLAPPSQLARHWQSGQHWQVTGREREKDEVTSIRNSGQKFWLTTGSFGASLGHFLVEFVD